MLTKSAVEQVFFRNSGMDAAQVETAQGCAVEVGEERISCSAALLPVLVNKYWLIKSQHKAGCVLMQWFTRAS
ncbi:hypothetical protein [Rheinheimera fenheensis]|uniref:hypothetical protein n=1 Tax=Rheinheimera fenheensis TaxID=3152295 RepID=UPI00325F50C2